MSGNNPINLPTTTSYTPMPKYQPRTPGFQSTQIYSMTPTASGRPQQGTYFREKSKTMFQSTMDFSSLSEPKSNPIPRSTYLSDNVSNQEYNRTPADNTSKLAVNHQFGRMRDAKMASSMIFTSNETETDFNRFPSFNLRNQQTVKTENQGNEGDSKQSAKQKRQKQIAAIKKQVESLNKKIQIKPLPNISLMDEMKPKQEPININNNPRNINNETTATSPYSFVPQKTRSQEAGKDVSGFQSGVGYRNNFLDSYKSDSTSLSSTKMWDDKPKSSSSSYNYPDPQSNKYNKPTSQKQPTQPRKQGMFLEPTASYEQYSFKKKNFSQQISQPVHAYQSPHYEQQPTSININNNANYNIGTAANVNTYTTASMNTHVNINTSTNITASNNDHNDVKNQMPKFKMSDFQVGKKMGKGQFGEVLLVRHKLTGWLCGLKVMDKKDIRSQGYVDQITRELSIQFYLQHRNIAQLYGYFEQGDKFYLLVQFCAGGHLLNQIRIQKRMNQEEVSKIIRQVCEGVDYIHKQQIIHRDIKPENILLNFDTVKICDFGWAVYRGFGMRKTASGSPLYYPPEIVKGEAYDDKIDIWNIGMMVYECLEGKIPFKIYSELDLNRIVQDEVSFPSYVDISEQAKDFILNTLKKNPDDRMQMRKMLRHPLLSKQKESALSDQVLNQLRKVLE